MLGTYAAALVFLGASVPVGAAVLAAAGRSRWSWLAPALGLALITALAWWAVRLPGEGLTALGAIVVVALLAGLWALPRVGPSAEDLREAAPAAGLTLLAVSIPFAAEGHFGILGTGFNVDMSQHLFAAEWIQSPLAPAPELVDQGYPVGPHSLAVAGAELTGGNLVTAFTGMTIILPVIGALAALPALRGIGPARATVAAVLVGIPYLVASYLAQGSFKELFEAVFVLAFAVWLTGVGRAEVGGLRFALPGAVLAVGALYAYSGPGLAWLIGTLAVWALLELARDRRATLGTVREALPGIGIGLVVLVVLVAPEASRIADFGTSAGNVANANDAEPAGSAGARAQVGSSDAEGGQLDLFNDDLGNLFGDIPALEVLGVWPSGDFRVEPGDGAAPAVVFYAGALLGLVALAVGLESAWRRRRTALLAAFVAALAIWLAAWAVSTPYTTAKALQMLAPILTLIAARGVLDPAFSPPPRPAAAGGLAALAGTALAVVFVAASAGSSALALANAPVGPERYTAGIAKLRDRLSGEPLLLLAPPGQVDDRHGVAYYGWELRGGRPICVEVFPESGSFGRPTPEGIHCVITVGGKKEPPFSDLVERSRRRRVTLWEAKGFAPATAPPVAIDPDEPTSCRLGLP
jgi:hypothetical protein